MRPEPNLRIEVYRATHPTLGRSPDGSRWGYFRISFKGGQVAHVIASDGMGWEHVSVSFEDRCPTWEEMCCIKELWWEDEETVVQYHPAAYSYVRVHPFALHLWKRSGEEFALPPRDLVG